MKRRSKRYKDNSTEDDSDLEFTPMKKRKFVIKKESQCLTPKAKASSPETPRRSVRNSIKDSQTEKEKSTRKKNEKENKYSTKSRKSVSGPRLTKSDVLKHIKINGSTNETRKSSGKESSTDDSGGDDDDDSDLDEMFFELKKFGIKRIINGVQGKKSTQGKIDSDKKKKPELEKSPQSVILNHKRVSKKRFDLLPDSPPVGEKKRKSVLSTRAESDSTPKKCEPATVQSLKKNPVEKTSNTSLGNKVNNDNINETPNRKRKCEIPSENFSSLVKKYREEGLENVTPKSRRKSTLKSSVNEGEVDSTFEVTTPKFRRCQKSLKYDGEALTPRTPSGKGQEYYEPKTPSSTILPSTPKTPLEKARCSLHVAAVPESLPCREREFKNVFSFLENKLLDGIGGCMYISGVPGTGKTATVTQVIKKLRGMAEKGTVPDFKFIEINGMRLADPRQAYTLLWQGLTDKKEKISPEQAQRKLDAWFGKKDPKDMKKPTLLLVDELDLICTRKQDVVYNLLDWPTKSPSRLIVITIANTMDMPERLFKGRVTSRLGLTRLTFQPYTYKQLEEIILTRLTGLNAFTVDAVRLVTRKVAAVSGDSRRSLDICRRATELPAPDETVKISHIEQAIREMTNSNIVKIIRGCSTLEKLFLRSVSDVSVRTGVDEVDLRDVIHHFLALTTLDGYSRLCVSNILSIANRLKCSRLLFVQNAQSGILQRLTLNVTQDDIHYGTLPPT